MPTHDGAFLFGGGGLGGLQHRGFGTLDTREPILKKIDTCAGNFAIQLENGADDV
jgi:hypothetical protein